MKVLSDSLRKNVRRTARYIGSAGILALALNVAACKATAAPNCQNTRSPIPGVNIAGGEFGNARPGRLAFDYAYPTSAEIKYFADAGFRLLRVPFLADRITTLREDGSTSLRKSDIAEMDRVVEAAKRRSLDVVLDLHEFGILNGIVGKDKIATASFVALWKAVAEHYAQSPNVVFGLMNEPHEQTPEEWLVGANAGIEAIRSAGAEQLILVPGTAWTGAHSWTASHNAEVMNNVFDSKNNFAIEVHQYLDFDSSGTSPDVVRGAGARSLIDFTNWARKHGLRAFLGEFAWANSPEANSEGDALIHFMTQNRDVWVAYAYWAAGGMWGDYMFSIEPKAGATDSRMRILKKYIEASKKQGSEESIQFEVSCK